MKNTEHLENLRGVRRMLFVAWLLNLVVVLVMWGFYLTGAMQAFRWAMPGYSLWSMNRMVMNIIAAADIAGAILFLIPAIALSIEILHQKRK